MCGSDVEEVYVLFNFSPFCWTVVDPACVSVPVGGISPYFTPDIVSHFH